MLSFQSNETGVGNASPNNDGVISYTLSLPLITPMIFEQNIKVST